MALPTSIEAPRHRSAADRLSEMLGGEHHLRMFLAALADALERGPVVVESDGVASNGRVMHAPLILAGRRPW